MHSESHCSPSKNRRTTSQKVRHQINAASTARKLERSIEADRHRYRYGCTWHYRTIFVHLCEQSFRSSIRPTYTRLRSGRMNRPQEFAEIGLRAKTK